MGVTLWTPRMPTSDSSPSETTRKSCPESSSRPLRSRPWATAGGRTAIPFPLSVRLPPPLRAIRIAWHHLDHAANVVEDAGDHVRSRFRADVHTPDPLQTAALFFDCYYTYYLYPNQSYARDSPVPAIRMK